MSNAKDITAATKRKAPRISAKLKRAIRHMVNKGVTQEKAAEHVGIARETLSRNLQKAHVRAYRDEVAQELIRENGIKGAQKVGQLINGARSERVQMEAAIDAQNRAGFVHEKDVDAGAPPVIVNIQLNT